MYDVEFPRSFILLRHEDASGISGVGHVAWGVEFPDGICAIRWNTDRSSTAVYSSREDVLLIHGHGGKTVMVYEDTEQPVAG